MQDGLFNKKSKISNRKCLSRFPLVQKVRQRLRRERAGIFKLAFLLAINDLAIALGDREYRDALIESRPKLLRDIGVLFTVVTNIDVNHFIIRIHDRREIRPLKGQVEYVAVEAPVRSEYQDQPLVQLRRSR